MYSREIKIGLEKGYFKISEDGKQITYFIKKSNNQNFGANAPEELVRAELLVELIEDFGYKPENFDFEVSAQQGSSGKTSVDMVIYKPKSNEAFAVIECKKDPPAEPIDKVRKQARSYAKAEELKTAQYYAYRIGEHPLVVFENDKDKEVSKLPYNYTESDIFAYIVEGKPLPPPPPHYKTLKISTPYDLKRIFKQCHDIIWNGSKDSKSSFNEFSKLLFLKMDDEIEREEKHLEHYIFQVQATETQEELFTRINVEYEKTLKRRKVGDLLKGLNLTHYQVYEIVKKLEPLSLITTDNDPKGLAFETFLDSYMKGELGQYFTPRNIVDFMLEISPISWSENISKNTQVLDPCCGSGSFLVHAINHFKRRFPKKTFWTYFANNSVHGIELDEDISVTAKVNIALHDDGHDNIKNANGLNAIKAKIEEGSIDLVLTNPPFGTIAHNTITKSISEAADLRNFFDFERFTITERKPDSIETIRKGNIKNLLNLDNQENIKKEYQKSVASEIIFFELYYKVMKVGGIAEIVIPDGILTNSSLQDVRDFISERFRILAVISLPQYTFTHYGAGVKTSIIMLQKLDYADTRRLQSAKLKYLENAVAKHENDLQKLENEKKTFTASYPDFLTLEQKQNDDEKAAKKQFANKPDALKKEIKSFADFYKKQHKQVLDSDEFKQWKKAKDEDLNDQIKSLKAHIYELANFNFKEFEKEWNYPIFMTVAENIGYDATGRETRKNDLPLIAQELKRFLKSVEDKQDDFFGLTLP